MGVFVESIHSTFYRQVIGELVAARKAAGLTQAEVAKRWGRQQSIVAKIETCERRIDVVEFVALGTIVGLKPTLVIDEIEKALKFELGQ